MKFYMTSYLPCFVNKTYQYCKYYFISAIFQIEKVNNVTESRSFLKFIVTCPGVVIFLDSTLVKV